MLNSTVLSLRVLTYCDQINIVVWGFITLYGFAGTDVSVQVKFPTIKYRTLTF